MKRFFLYILIIGCVSTICGGPAVGGVVPAVNGDQVRSAHRPVPLWAKSQSPFARLKERLANRSHAKEPQLEAENKSVKSTADTSEAK
jgi:hypothetical protein